MRDFFTWRFGVVTMEIEILPTNTCPPTFEEMLRRSAVIAGIAPWMQIDVCDGAFAAEKSWPYLDDGKVGDISLSGVKGVHAEIHLMIEEPREVGLRFIEAGARRVLGHVEAFADSSEVLGALDLWKSRGVEAGLAILLDTPIEVLEPLVPHCDVVQVMTIGSIGRQGIAFDTRGIDRIQALHTNFPDLLISADGGVTDKNIAELVRAGARRFGVGSAIMKSPDPISAYRSLKATGESAIE